ncbi:MAG: HAMP domain-containing histidine kinase, partial [Bacilli bacterium]|nr:HAMP domain-containing histidine kinase [Bacilli bacterium]
DALNFVGHAFGVSRVYIFETDEKNPDLCHNTFEWCAPGIKPQKTKLQNVSYQRYGYDKFFGASELFCCEDRNLANPEMKEELASQNIVAMVNYAFYDKGRLAGFVGYDDCEKVRPDWSREKEDVEILVFVAELLAMYLIKERNRLRAVESKANETFLRAKEEENRILLRHFVEAYTSAYMVNLAERSFEIIHMSHEFQQVFTMNGGMADMARFVDNHVHPDDREMMRKMTDPDYVRARMKEEREISFTMREIYDDEERTMHVIIIRSVDCDHVAIGFMDVTAELKKEKEINEKLEIAAKARRGFLSSMSHDIRTPMNAILGMVDIALNHPDDKAKMIDSLQKIRTSGNHLLLLVNDVLDISAIESGKTELRPVVHAVKEKARFIQNTIQGILNGKDIAFHFDQHDILYPWIVVDETRLNQIINNLLSNAVKYTPEGGSVRFENYHERDEEGKPWNVIAISDTGIGMSEEFMAKMWEAFSRATDTRINEIQGAGLGLSIVKSLVDMMGGTITVESRLNVGSTFTVRLPIVPASPEALPAEAQAEESEKEGEVSAHVLVAEDNDLNWEVASELLAMHGITCVRA